MKTDLSTYRNDAYKGTLPGPLKRVLWLLTNVVFFQNPLFVFYSPKVMLLRAFGAKVGEGVIIKPSVNIKYAWNLRIGDHAWIGEKVWIDNLAMVTVGESVCISQGAMLLTGNHDYTKQGFDLMVKGIVLEEGCWIGAQSVVCPGVTCRSHSVLSVGSVANKELEAYTIYQGNPAVPVKERVING